ncbi:MAG: DUF922 domain-containing protein [Notoacmeibacter sp.]|nr:DUF922 domain-containing protein [Notoacmeibacter sp.]MCC0031901.1 DUF922 domain-containing protein [Brucellaceae bacterium]
MRTPFRILFSALVLMASLPVQAADKQVTERYYRVHGRTVAELDAVVRANAPRGGRSRGMGIIDLDRRYRLETQAGGCRVASAAVTARATLILPKWREGGQPEAAVQRHWRGLERHVRAHEYGHVTIAARYARLLEARLMKLRHDGSCWALGAEAGKLIERTLGEHSEAQRAYDARTLAAMRRKR